MIAIATVGAFALVCLLAVMSPAWALALIMTMYAFEQAAQASNMLFVRILPLANFMVAASAGLCLVRAVTVRRGLFEGYFNPVWWGTVVIFGFSAMSLAWTPARDTAATLLVGQAPYFVLFILIAPLLVRDAESIVKFSSTFLFVGVLIIGLMLVNPAFTVKSGRLGFHLDATVRTNPLAMGELGGNILIAAALFRVGVRAWFIQLIRIAGFMMGAMLSLQSGSRGQVIFAVIIAAAFYPVSTRVKNLKGFILGAAGAIILVPLVLVLAQYILGAEELRRWDANALSQGTNVRMANALELFIAWVKTPHAWLMGLGFNAFTAVSAARSEPYSHFMFLDILCEEGIPMFILFCVVVGLAAKDAIWLFRRFADSQRERAALAILFGFFFYQVLLVNKQGYLWAATVFFFLMVTVARLRRCTEADDLEWEQEHEGEEQDESAEPEDENGEGQQLVAPTR